MKRFCKDECFETDDDLLCKAAEESRSYACTRLKGHKGVHVACGSDSVCHQDKYHCYVVWDDEQTILSTLAKGVQVIGADWEEHVDG